MRPELIEQAIQRYYIERPVQLTAKDVQKRTEAIQALVAVSQTDCRPSPASQDRVDRQAQGQQIRLIRLHAEEGDDISGDAFRDERLRMQTEIRAAEKSLAETEQRLTLDADMLRMALELAGDVAQVYAAADESTKRGYNQAFFSKLYITPEWDENHSQTIVQVSDAELTEPHAALLATDFVHQITSEIKLIRRASSKAESGPYEPLSDADVSIRLKLAEGEGFEPPKAFRP